MASPANFCTIKDQIDQSPIILELPNREKLVLSFDFIEWFRGFTDAEGCFFIKTSKSKTHKLGLSVTLNFLVVQNIRDAYLLESFVQFFGCGSFSIVEKSGIGTFAVRNFSHIIETIIPFFEQYSMLGTKVKDFEDFKEASLLIKSKSYLTKEGLEKIIFIKSRMNFNR